jgi:preprotein translocase subunit SecD
VTFTGAGREQFAKVTKEHLHQRLAIVIDGKLWMAPTVQAEITEGKAIITGSFSADEANALVAQNNGAVAK